jgi:hypothetical protein
MAIVGGKAGCRLANVDMNSKSLPCCLSLCPLFFRDNLLGVGCSGAGIAAEKEEALGSLEAREVEAKGSLMPSTWHMAASEVAVEKALEV